jgi:ribosomal protein L18
MSCDGSGLRETLLRAHSYDGEDATASAKRKADVEKWAALLATAATQAQSTTASVGLAPDGWRGDVEAMTPTALEHGSSATTAETRTAAGPAAAMNGTESEDNRVQVRVTIGELGEVALVVERSADGVRVQISAQDNRVLEMMSREQEALTSALAGVGQSITSLAFVAMDRVGINFAQPRSASLSDKTPRESKSTTQQAAHEKRKSRRVDVIG